MTDTRVEKKRPYEKPELKVIEMREEEVLAVGCKMDGPFNVASEQPNCGVGVPCSLTGS